jgi:hypothetical protein
MFGIKYMTSYSVTFGAPSNPTGMSFVLDHTETSGSYTYVIYAWTGDYTPDWSENSENLVMEVTISGGTGTGNFSLVSGEGLVNGFDPNYYVEFKDGPSNTLYNATASDVPLPVELVSFTVSETRKGARLDWKTATEVNNFGFDVERRQNNGTTNLWSKIGFVEGNGTCNTSHEYRYVDNNLIAGTYSYRLKQIDRDGAFKYCQAIDLTVQLPTKFELQQNYPNPFNPTTVIEYQLPEQRKVEIWVYNALGERLVTLVDGVKDAGYYKVEWDSRGDSRLALPSGIYFYRMTGSDHTIIKKMLLLK